MHRNRISPHLSDGPVSTFQLPRQPVGMTCGAFSVCPIAVVQTPWQQQLYQEAYEQAREAVRHAAFRRLLTVSSN
jgi:hypothetical protein